MNTFEILLQHREIANFTQDDYLRLEQRLKAKQSYSLDDYLIQKKIFTTQWTNSYHALHSKTRTYHFIKIYRVSLLVEEEKPSEINRLRKLSRNIMRMNPEHAMKCYECLENEDFFIMVMEWCKQEDTLQNSLKEAKYIKQSIAVQWIKQIICGLAELYKQNIYLPDINTNKICLIENKCKINDFRNIEKKLTLTEADIVKKHIRELARLFYFMLTGEKHFEEKNFIDFNEVIQEVFHKNKLNLSGLAKDFLHKFLYTCKSLSWQELIEHKLFTDETKRSSNLQFLKLSQIHPQIPFKNRQSQSTSQITTSHLKQVNRPTCQQQEWDSQQFIEIQKTKLILGKIIHDIDQDKIFDITDREVVQIVYLMTVRCLNNFNEINISKDKLQKSQIFINLRGQMEKLEKQVSQNFYKYSSMLTEKQNQKLQVGKDWLNMAKSIVKLQFFESKRRNKFLTGIQNTQQHQHDYTKQQQIDFTQQSITNFLKKCKFHYSQKDHVFYYMRNYKKIMDVKVDQLEFVTFQQKVKEILFNTENPFLN